MSKMSDNSVNKILVGVLVFLCVAIVGLGVGIGIMYGIQQGAVSGCRETLDANIDQYGDNMSLGNEMLGRTIELFQECIDEASVEEQVELCDERARIVSSYDNDDKYGDLVMNDLIFVDDNLRTIDSAINVINAASSYGYNNYVAQYQSIMIERMAEAGEDYYEGASG